MMTRPSIHQAFVDRFADLSSGPVSVITETDLHHLEQKFRVSLPTAYREFAIQHGAVHTPSLLPLIVDGEVDIADILHFEEGSQLIENAHLYWKGGMTEELIPFATDCMGNMFCFRRATILEQREDAPVWFFDHDFGTDEQITDGFDEWLTSFLALPASPLPQS